MFETDFQALPEVHFLLRKTHHQEELDFQKEASNLLRVRVGLCKRFPEVSWHRGSMTFGRATPPEAPKRKTGWKIHHWVKMYCISLLKNGALLQFLMLMFRGIRSWISWNFETKASWKLEQLQVHQLSLVSSVGDFFLAGSVGNTQLFKGGVTCFGNNLTINHHPWNGRKLRFFSWKLAKNLGSCEYHFDLFLGAKENNENETKECQHW